MATSNAQKNTYPPTPLWMSPDFRFYVHVLTCCRATVVADSERTRREKTDSCSIGCGALGITAGDAPRSGSCVQRPGRRLETQQRSRPRRVGGQRERPAHRYPALQIRDRSAGRIANEDKGREDPQRGDPVWLWLRAQLPGA